MRVRAARGAGTRNRGRRQVAEIRSFRGIRFDQARAGDISALISPPYDVISPELRSELHRRNDYNFVRLVLGQDLPGDDASHNRFTRAGDSLREWLTRGVLSRDELPSLYRLTVEYELRGVRKTLHGITALVRLHPYEHGVVLPHEKTLQGPKEGLRQLMIETGCNLDSVWMMYEDNEGGVRGAMESIRWSPLVSGARDTAGTVYSLESCSDTDAIESIASALRDQPLIIADGHHRYETAMGYAREMDQAHPDADRRPWQYVMATLVWTDAPGLTVLPTHRVIRGLSSDVIDSLPDFLSEKYDLTAVREDELDAALEREPSSSFAWWDGSRSVLARPKLPVDATAAELLQQNVLAQQFGFDIEHLKTDPRIAYVEEAQQALALVRDGGYQAAFLLKPVPVRTITRYAQEGRCLPQKSTYFYPKLASGLVMREIGEESRVVA